MAQTWTMTVEMPPFSGNHRHGVMGRRKFRTRQYKSWLETLQSHLPSEPPFSPDSRLVLTVGFQFNDKRRRDLDNCLKSLLDGMNGRVFHDDCQIHCLIAAKDVGDKMLINVTVDVLPNRV